MRRAVIIVVAMCFAISSVVASEAEATQKQESVETAEINAQEPSDAGLKANVTAVAARLIQEYVTPSLCSYSPDFCDKHQLRKFLDFIPHCTCKNNFSNHSHPYF